MVGENGSPFLVVPDIIVAYGIELLNNAGRDCANDDNIRRILSDEKVLPREAPSHKMLNVEGLRRFDNVSRRWVDFHNYYNYNKLQADNKKCCEKEVRRVAATAWDRLARSRVSEM